MLLSLGVRGSVRPASSKMTDLRFRPDRTVVAGKYRVGTCWGRWHGSVWAGRHVTLGQLAPSSSFNQSWPAARRPAAASTRKQAAAASKVRPRWRARPGVSDNGQPISSGVLGGRGAGTRHPSPWQVALSEVVQIVAPERARVVRGARSAHRPSATSSRTTSSSQGTPSRRSRYSVKLVDFGIARWRRKRPKLARQPRKRAGFRPPHT